MQPFITQFTLTRDYLAESFDQSLPYGKSAKLIFLFPALLFVIGAGLLAFTEQPKIAGIILIAMSVLELLHIRFRRAWWLMRQTWGRSNDSEVTLTIDAEGVQTKNAHTHTTLLWADIERVIETDLGLILVAISGSQQYLSKSLFPAEGVSDIVAKIKAESKPEEVGSEE